MLREKTKAPGNSSNIASTAATAGRSSVSRGRSAVRRGHRAVEVTIPDQVGMMANKATSDKLEQDWSGSRPTMPNDLISYRHDRYEPDGWWDSILESISRPPVRASSTEGNAG
jgi:hypothetical protein